MNDMLSSSETGDGDDHESGDFVDAKEEKINDETNNVKDQNIDMKNLPYIFHSTIFKIISIKDKHISVQCNHCKNNRIVKGNIRSTGNFLSHLRRKHPNLLEKLHTFKVDKKISNGNLRSSSTTKSNIAVAKKLPIAPKPKGNKYRNTKTDIINVKIIDLKNEVGDADFVHTDNGHTTEYRITKTARIDSSNRNSKEMDDYEYDDDEIADHDVEIEVMDSSTTSSNTKPILGENDEYTLVDKDSSAINSSNNQQMINAVFQDLPIVEENQSVEYCFSQYVAKELSVLSEPIKIRTKFRINRILYEAQSDNLKLLK